MSSLSTNSGKTVKGKKQGGGSGGGKGNDSEFDFALKPGGAAGSSAGASSSSAGKQSTWLGKSPMDFVREWCAKNNRKKP